MSVRLSHTLCMEMTAQLIKWRSLYCGDMFPKIKLQGGGHSWNHSATTLSGGGEIMESSGVGGNHGILKGIFNHGMRPFRVRGRGGNHALFKENMRPSPPPEPAQCHLCHAKASWSAPTRGGKRRVRGKGGGRRKGGESGG